MQSVESSGISDNFPYESNSMSYTQLITSNVWADVHGDENVDDGGVDLDGSMDTPEFDSFENMDDMGDDVFVDTETEVFENMECVSNDETVEHVESSSLKNVESTSPENIESTSPENVESSSPENVESTSPENIESTSPENVESSSPEHVSTFSYAASLGSTWQPHPTAPLAMSKKNYKGVMSAGIKKKSIVTNKHTEHVTTDETMEERVSIADMKNLQSLGMKYDASGEKVKMYEGVVGKTQRVYDPDELYLDQRTDITRTLTAAELCTSRRMYTSAEKNRNDSRNHRGDYKAKTAVLCARIAELEDIVKKYQDLTGLTM